MRPTYPVAVFGAIFEGDPLGNGPPIRDTIYPPCNAVAERFSMDPQFLHKILMTCGHVKIIANRQLIVAMRMDLHLNNSSMMVH